MMLRTARWIARMLPAAVVATCIILAAAPAAMAQNAATQNWWEKLIDPKTLLALVSLVIAAVVTMTKVQGHCADRSVHHTREELDEHYMPRDLSDERWANLHATLSRIEAAIAAMHAGGRRS